MPPPLSFAIMPPETQTGGPPKQAAMIMIFPLFSLLPHDIIAEHIGQFHGFAVTQGTAPQFSGEIWDAPAPIILIGQLFNDALHGHPGPDDIGLDLIPVIHLCLRFSVRFSANRICHLANAFASECGFLKTPVPILRAASDTLFIRKGIQFRGFVYVHTGT
jgi:hypothetical protein